MSVQRPQKYKVENQQRTTYLQQTTEDANKLLAINRSYITKHLTNSRYNSTQEVAPFITKTHQEVKNFISDYKKNLQQYSPRQHLSQLLKQNLHEKIMGYEPTSFVTNIPKGLRPLSMSSKDDHSHNQKIVQNALNVGIKAFETRDTIAQKPIQVYSYLNRIEDHVGPKSRQDDFLVQIKGEKNLALSRDEGNIKLRTGPREHSLPLSRRTPNRYLDTKDEDGLHNKLEFKNLQLQQRIQITESELEEMRKQNNRTCGHYQQCLLNKQNELDQLKIENISLIGSVQGLNDQLREARNTISQQQEIQPNVPSKNKNKSQSPQSQSNQRAAQKNQQLQNLIVYVAESSLGSQNQINEQISQSMDHFEQRLSFIQRNINKIKANGNNKSQQDSTRKLDPQDIIDDLKAEKDSFMKRFKSLEEKYKETSQQNMQLNKNISLLQQDVEKNNQQILNSVTNQLQPLIEKGIFKGSDLVSLNKINQQVIKIILQQQDDLEISEVKMQHLQKDFQQQVDDLNHKLGQELDSFNKICSQSKIENQNLKGSLKQLSEKYKELQAVYQQTQKISNQNNNESQQKFDTLQSKCNKLQDQNTKLNQEGKKHDNDEKQFQVLKEELQIQIKQIQDELQKQIQQSKQELQKQNSIHQKEVLSLQEQQSQQYKQLNIVQQKLDQQKKNNIDQNQRENQLESTILVLENQNLELQQSQQQQNLVIQYLEQQFESCQTDNSVKLQDIKLQYEEQLFQHKKSSDLLSNQQDQKLIEAKDGIKLLEQKSATIQDSDKSAKLNELRYKEKIQGLKQTVNLLQQDLQAKESKQQILLEQIKLEKVEFGLLIEHTQQSLLVYKNKNQKLQGELLRSQEEKQIQSQEKEQLQQEIIAIKNINQDLEGQNLTLNEKLNDMNAQMNIQFQESSKDIISLKGQLTQQQDQHKSQRVDECVLLQSEIGNLHNQIKELNKQFSVELSQKEVQQQQNIELFKVSQQQQIDNLNTSNKLIEVQFSQEIFTLNDTINVLNQEIQQKDNIIHDLNQALKDNKIQTDGQIDQLIKASERTNIQVANDQEIILQQNQDYLEKEEDCESLQADVQSLRGRIVELENEIQQYKLQSQKTHQQSVADQLIISEQQNQITSLQQDIDKQDDVIKLTVEELKQFKGYHKNSQYQIEQLKELNELQEFKLQEQNQFESSAQNTITQDQIYQLSLQLEEQKVQNINLLNQIKLTDDNNEQQIDEQQVNQELTLLISGIDVQLVNYQNTIQQQTQDYKKKEIECEQLVQLLDSLKHINKEQEDKTKQYLSEREKQDQLYSSSSINVKQKEEQIVNLQQKVESLNDALQLTVEELTKLNKDYTDSSKQNNQLKGMIELLQSQQREQNLMNQTTIEQGQERETQDQVEIQKLQHNQQQLILELEGLKIYLADQEKTFNQAQQQIEQALQSQQDLSDQRAIQQQAINVQTEQEQQQGIQIVSLQNKIEQQNQELRDQQKANKDLQQQYDELLNMSQQEHEVLNTRISEINSQISDSQNTIRLQNVDLQAKAKEQEYLATEIQSLTNMIKEHEDRIQQYSTQLDQSNQQKINDQSIIQQKEQQIVGLEQELVKLNNVLQLTLEELNQLQVIYKNSTQHNEQLKEMIELQQFQLQEQNLFKSSNLDKDQENQQYQEKLKNQIVEFERDLKQQNTLVQIQENLQDKLKQSEISNQELSLTIQSIGIQLQDKDAILLQKDQDYKQQLKQYDQLLSEVESLRNEIQTLQEKFDPIKLEQQFKERVDPLIKEISEKDQQLEILQNTCRVLQDEKDILQLQSKDEILPNSESRILQQKLGEFDLVGSPHPFTGSNESIHEKDDHIIMLEEELKFKEQKITQLQNAQSVILTDTQSQLEAQTVMVKKLQEEIKTFQNNLETRSIRSHRSKLNESQQMAQFADFVDFSETQSQQDKDEMAELHDLLEPQSQNSLLQRQESLKFDKQNLEEEFRFINEQNKMLGQEVDMLKDELEDLKFIKSQNEKLMNQINEASEDKNTLQQQIEDLEQQIQDLQQKLDNTQYEKAALTEVTKQQQQQMLNLEKQLSVNLNNIYQLNEERLSVQKSDSFVQLQQNQEKDKYQSQFEQLKDLIIQFLQCIIDSKRDHCKVLLGILFNIIGSQSIQSQDIIDIVFPKKKDKKKEKDKSIFGMFKK